MERFKYTQSWFIGSELDRNLSNFTDPSRINNILEIGCYEGLSSVFLAETLLNSPQSTLTCVDPFLNVSDNDHKVWLSNNQEDNFDYNISVCKNYDKITVHKVTSDKFFETNTKTYNFIYIDGCHIAEFITRDMENSFKYLENRGIMWMDDYLGDNGRIAIAMNAFLDKYNGQYDLIHKGYQLAIRKH